MSKTHDRIPQEQFGQGLLAVTNDSFAAGAFQLSEYHNIVVGELTGDAEYTLRLAPAGVAEGRFCSLMLSAGVDTTLNVLADGVKLYDAITADSVIAVVYCDGVLWHKLWDKAERDETEERIAAIEARLVVPDGGDTNEVLAKASDDDGDFEWQVIPKIPAGGTTGQVLAKKSDDDFDVEWITLN